MTYFNPKIYCTDNLLPKDKECMWYYDHAVEDVLNAFDNINFYSENGDTLDQIRNEVGIELREEIREWMAGERVQVICSIMDNDDAYGDLEEVENYSVPDWAKETEVEFDDD